MTLKKFTLAILLTFTLTIAYQVFAAYLTSPENLKYPNPGHYPGEIGPGTFNCSNNTNCFWRFPNALFINSTSGKVGIGTENPKETLEVQGNTKIQGNLEVTGKGNFFELCIQGNCTTFWPTGGGTGEITFDVWSASKSDSDSCDEDGETATANCTVQIPEGYTVIYAHGATGYYNSWATKQWYYNIYAEKCAFPSYEMVASGGWSGGYETPCKELPCLGKKGPTTCELTISKTCKWIEGYMDYYDVMCGLYVIAVKATGAGVGAIEDIWVNETGDTMTGDLNVTGGIVVGNPAGGNKGPGTINAQKIYVNGSEVGGGSCVVLLTSCSCLGGSCVDANCPCDPPTASCPSGYTLAYESITSTKGAAIPGKLACTADNYIKATTCCK